MSNDGNPINDIDNVARMIAEATVAHRNEIAGLPRWYVTNDGKGTFGTKDLSVVLAQLPLGPTGRAVTLLESGPEIVPSGDDPCRLIDTSVIAWREHGQVRIEVVFHDAVMFEEDYDGVWDGGLDALAKLGLLPTVFDGGSFDRLVAELHRGVEHPGANRRWATLWCPSYEELLARLELAEAYVVPDLKDRTPHRVPLEAELFWFRNETVLLTYRSEVLDGVDFRLVADRRGDVVRVRKILAPSPYDDEDADERPHLAAFAWAPFVLTPETHERLRRQAERMVAHAADEPHPASPEVVWCGMSFEEIVAATDPSTTSTP